MGNSNVVLQLSCYNGARYLPFLFASLKQQTHQTWRLIILDNASKPEEGAAIQKAVQASDIPAELYRVEENIGFAGAHNFLFEKHKHESDFVLLLNDDAILEPTYIETLVAHMMNHPKCGSCEGVIYRWDFEHHYREDDGKTCVIDTMGLTVSKTGAVKDVCAGETLPSLNANHPSLTALLGVSGCLPMFRTRALRMVSADQTLFDPTFVIYKEDVELAYRLRAAGFLAQTITSTKAYHRRSLGKGVKHMSDPQAAYRSYLNHIRIHLMHTRVIDLFTNRWLVLSYECLKTLYWLVRKPSFIFDAAREIKTSWPELMRKRSLYTSLREATKQRNGKALLVPETYDCDVAVIMVSHNDLSEECLLSIQKARAQSSLNIQLVVIDNQSHTYHANEFVKPLVPDAIVLLRHGDFGYGRSCNRGTRELVAKYYFILNPDTVITDPTLFETFVRDLETHPNTGIIAPKIVYPNDQQQETCRRFPKWFMPFVMRTNWQNHGFGKTYLESFVMRDYDHAQKRNVDWVQGSAMFIPGDVWRTLDGFDDRYWLYFEDIDLCRRVHLLNKEVVYNPSVCIQHAYGKESATYKNNLMNILIKKESRSHIMSWIKYTLKWFI